MFNLKDMYSFLLSHTFPGLLVTCELILSLQWFVTPDVYPIIHTLWTAKTSNTIIIIILLYVVSTLFGIILDAVHHLLFEDLPGLILKDWAKLGAKFPAITDSLRVDIYKHFLEDDFWYPYEAYSNIAIALLPGILLFKHWLSSIQHVQGWYCWLWLSLYTIILLFMIAEALFTLRNFVTDEKQFIETYSTQFMSETTINEAHIKS